MRRVFGERMEAILPAPDLTAVPDGNRKTKTSSPSGKAHRKAVFPQEIF